MTPNTQTPTAGSLKNDDPAPEQDHIYVGRIPGMRSWSPDYDLIAEWAGGEENVTIMHWRAHSYIVDLSDDEDVIANQEACVNHRYDCGHLAYGPPRRLPEDCSECNTSDYSGGDA